MTCLEWLERQVLAILVLFAMVEFLKSNDDLLGSANDRQLLSGSCPHERDPQSSVLALTVKSHLHRERNLIQFQDALLRWNSTELDEVKAHLLSSLTETEQSWEALYGILKGSVLLIKYCWNNDHQFAEDLLDSIISLVSHFEARVRSATSSLIRELAMRLGLLVWDRLGDRLLASVSMNFQLDENQRLREAARLAGRDVDEDAANAKLHGLRMVHETEGWRGLETSLLALADLLDGCGGYVLAPAAGIGGLGLVDGLVPLFDSVRRAKDHPNRFVREAGLKLLTSATNASRSDGMNSKEDGMRVLTLIVGICKPVIIEGLQDNWSQVRFAATMAVRSVLEGFPQEQRRNLYPGLLPRMCLNRHYVAEGVRNLSQKTWREIIALDGKAYLSMHLEETIEYYESQCEADNHAVREAACQGLGELCEKLERSKVEVFVPRVIHALIGCLKDESWPVRDHACRALGLVVSKYPQAAEMSGNLDELYGLFEQHLADNIGSVRANCADSYARVCMAFDPDHESFGHKRALSLASRLMGRLRCQPEQTFTAGKVTLARDRDTKYGAASKLARDNDASLHTNQTTYSCGSLAPKLRRGGGCMDHGFAREKEPWEEADGGMKLWKGLARNEVDGAWDAEVLHDVLELGQLGMSLRFAQELKVKVGWFECFVEALTVVKRGALTEEVSNTVVSLIERGRTMDNQGVKAAAAACARAMRRVCGLRMYAKIEREIAQTTTQ